MKQFSNKEIVTKFEEIFAGDNPEIEVEKNDFEGGRVVVRISQMYEYVPLNFPILKKISEFFETEHIDDSRYAYGGCDTCDYGSSYSIVLTIWDKK